MGPGKSGQTQKIKNALQISLTQIILKETTLIQTNRVKIVREVLMMVEHMTSQARSITGAEIPAIQPIHGKFKMQMEVQVENVIRGRLRAKK